MITSFTGPNKFLSNFYSVTIRYDGTDYPSVEHAYQAAKTTKQVYRTAILQASTPGQAKRLGRQIPPRPGWDNKRITIMHNLIRRKFAKEPLRQMLLNTGTQQLIESNTQGDYFWGLCGGRGQNHLGIILMSIRSELRTDERYNDKAP